MTNENRKLSFTILEVVKLVPPFLGLFTYTQWSFLIVPIVVILCVIDKYSTRKLFSIVLEVVKLIPPLLGLFAYTQWSFLLVPIVILCIIDKYRDGE